MQMGMGYRQNLLGSQKDKIKLLTLYKKWTIMKIDYKTNIERIQPATKAIIGNPV